MNIDNNKIQNDFISDLTNHIDKEKIEMKLSKKSDSELILENPETWMLLEEIHNWEKNKFYHKMENIKLI